MSVPVHQHRVFLSLGSNLGDKRLHLGEAVRRLEISGVQVQQASPIYVTEPVDFAQQDWFLNQVLEGSALLPPHELLETCLAIEREMGRERRQLKGPRTIDIDILLYDDLVIDSEILQIPHPRMHLRRFVLEPLAHLAPKLMHPVIRESIEALRARCPDRSQVLRADDH
jgi:2-amino-4-hydroxy-6-hydroxymethyldihydropteridine diphosphokinase